MAATPQSPYADDLDPAMVEILRTKSPPEKMAMVDAMWRSARNQILLMLRNEHPEWSETQVRRETASRLSHGAV